MGTDSDDKLEVVDWICEAEVRYVGEFQVTHDSRRDMPVAETQTVKGLEPVAYLIGRDGYRYFQRLAC